MEGKENYLGLIAHTYSPTTCEAEARGLLQVQGQPVLHRMFQVNEEYKRTYVE